MTRSGVVLAKDRMMNDRSSHKEQINKSGVCFQTCEAYEFETNDELVISISAV